MSSQCDRNFRLVSDFHSGFGAKLNRLRCLAHKPRNSEPWKFLTGLDARCDVAPDPEIDMREQGTLPRLCE